VNLTPNLYIRVFDSLVEINFVHIGILLVIVDAILHPGFVHLAFFATTVFVITTVHAVFSCLLL
jgi:hypothetical protein